MHPPHSVNTLDEPRERRGNVKKGKPWEKENIEME